MRKKSNATRIVLVILLIGASGLMGWRIFNRPTPSEAVSIALGDLAEILDTVEEERRLSRFSSRPAVTIDLVARPNANVVALASRVYEELEKIQPSLPEGMSLNVIFDNNVSIEDTIKNVISDMLMATLLTARRPVLTTVIALILILLGDYCYLNMGVAFLPQMDIPVVMVRASYDGASPPETESTLVKPFEDAVARVEGVKTIRGFARNGSGSIVIELENDVDNTQAAMDIATQVRALPLPDGVDDPSVVKFDINARAFMTLVAVSDLPASQVRDIAEEQVSKRLIQIYGMATAEAALTHEAR